MHLKKALNNNNFHILGKQNVSIYLIHILYLLYVVILQSVYDLILRYLKMYNQFIVLITMVYYNHNQ